MQVHQQGGVNESLLHEMSEEGGDGQPQGDYYEKQAAGYPGEVPELRDEGVQDRQGLSQL